MNSTMLHWLTIGFPLVPVYVVAGLVIWLAAPKLRRGPTVVSFIGLSVVQLSLLVGVSLTSWQYPVRCTVASGTCSANLLALEGAKQQWALEMGITNAAATPIVADLLPYLGPKSRATGCPGGGIYRIGNLKETPTCDNPDGTNHRRRVQVLEELKCARPRNQRFHLGMWLVGSALLGCVRLGGALFLAAKK